MTYDEDLANRLRELLCSYDGIAEKKMFGGLSFMVHGNMAVSASGRGGGRRCVSTIDCFRTGASRRRFL